MIRYALTCKAGHRFESWFKSTEDFEKLHAGGMVSCAVCGSANVEKGLMAPQVNGMRDEADHGAPERPLSAPASPAEQALAELKKKIEANSDYVGRNFVHEARRIHSGDAPERAIHGEASMQDARRLVQDGVPVMPLPFTTGRKTN